jgi:hypothetical protein
MPVNLAHGGGAEAGGAQVQGQSELCNQTLSQRKESKKKKKKKNMRLI